MADFTIEQDTLPDLTFDGVELSDGSIVQTVELVGATEGGAKAVLAKAEDTPHATGDQGIMLLAVRKDSATALATSDGDYIPVIVDSAGRLHVSIGDGTTVASVRNLASNDALNVAIVDGSGAQVTSFAGTGGTSMTDDAAFTPGTTPITPSGALFDDATPDSVDEGDAGVLRMSGNRALYVQLRDAEGNERGLNIDSSGALAVGTVPAASRTTDHVGAAEMTGTIMQGLTERTPVFAVIDKATSGDNTLVAAQGSGNKIRVYSLFMVSTGIVTVRFESGAGGTALTGHMSLVANTGFVLPHNPLGWFETAADTLLNLELSAATSVDGCMVWSVVT